MTKAFIQAIENDLEGKESLSANYRKVLKCLVKTFKVFKGEEILATDVSATDSKGEILAKLFNLFKDSVTCCNGIDDTDPKDYHNRYGNDDDPEVSKIDNFENYLYGRKYCKQKVLAFLEVFRARPVARKSFLIKTNS